MCLQLPPGTQIISAPTQDHVIEFQYQALLKEHQSDLLLQSDEFKLQRQADLYQQAKQTVLGSNYVIPTSIGTSKGILNAFGILNTVGEIIGRLFGSLPSADY
jgi:hypothetical protein